MRNNPNLLKIENKPSLEAFLQDDEIFMDLMVGKDYGFFNSILIKCRQDLENSLKKYKKEVEVESSSE